MREWNLEGQRDERVCQGHYQIRNQSRQPPPNDQLIELEDGVTFFWSDELHVDWQEEGETEECNDNQVDKADRDCWYRHIWVERSEVEHREPNGWVESLRRFGKIRSRNTGVRHNLSHPHLTEHASDLSLQHTQLGQYVVVVRVLISS